MKENTERVIDSLLDDYLEEFRAEHPIDNSFLTIYKDYKAVFVKEAAESADENIKDKMTDNHAKILELIKSQYNGLFKDVKELEDED